MPGSVNTNSNCTVVSAKSVHSRCSSYKRVNNCSVVDDSLFGEPHRLRAIKTKEPLKYINGREDDIKINIFCNTRRASDCPPEVVHGHTKRMMVPTTELIRDLVIPDGTVKKKTIFLSRPEIERIRNTAHILTEEEIKQHEAEEKRIREQLMTESSDRKYEMKKLDIARRVNEKLNDLEEDAKQRSQYLLAKAMEQRQDEEEEIKQLNEAITNAKIQAIRDCQVLEKQQIQIELKEENQRLDNMMEIDRQNAIKIQAAIEAKRKEEELLGACEIIKQINQNEQDRLLKLEKAEQENMAARKRVANEMIEEMNRRIEKKTKQNLLREDLDKSTELMIKLRTKQAEEDRLFDLKILQEQKDKADREAAYEEEQRRIRLEKEKETNRLRGLQERANDEQAERDALRARRAMEENERHWRRKELAAAKKAKETKEEMNRERIKAAENKTRILAMEATRNKMDFGRILQHQKDLIAKEKLDVNRRNKMKIEFCNGLRSQICEKEQQRIAERNAFFEEGVRMEEEARLRRLRLEDAKTRKMVELRNAGLPEKYLTEIERKTIQIKEKT